MDEIYRSTMAADREIYAWGAEWKRGASTRVQLLVDWREAEGHAEWAEVKLLSTVHKRIGAQTHGITLKQGLYHLDWIQKHGSNHCDGAWGAILRLARIRSA